VELNVMILNPPWALPK